MLQRDDGTSDIAFVARIVRFVFKVSNEVKGWGGRLRINDVAVG
jgi:hypothetical protein